MSHKTRNDLPKGTRKRMIDLLNARLADSIDLYSQAKQAHWNVKGPNFIALHGLFDKVADSATAAVDELAERAVELGGIANGTIATVAKRTRLLPYPTDISAGVDHVERLADALAAYGALI